MSWRKLAVISKRSLNNSTGTCHGPRPFLGKHFFSIALTVTAACPTRTQPRLAGCKKDVDCKGTRVCNAGRCVELHAGPPKSVGGGTRPFQPPTPSGGSPPFAMGRGD